jgi:hypothetical protein
MNASNKVVYVDFRHKEHREPVPSAYPQGSRGELPYRSVMPLQLGLDAIRVMSLGFFNFVLTCLQVSVGCLLVWWR